MYDSRSFEDDLNLAKQLSKGQGPTVDYKHLKKVANIPDNFKIGYAIDNGGCFFDSLAQILNFENGDDCYSEKSLREFCYLYYLENIDEVHSLIKASEGSIDTNYENVQYAEAGLIGAPIWLRPTVEGVIICRVLGIPAIQVIDIYDSGLVCSTMVTADGCIDQEGISYDETIPTILALGSSLHYVPLLPTGPSKQNVVNPGLNPSDDFANPEKTKFESPDNSEQNSTDGSLDVASNTVVDNANHKDALKTGLQQYVNARAIDPRGLYSFFSRSGQDKIDAANQVLGMLQGKRENLSDVQIDCLLQGNLGNIINTHKKSLPDGLVKQLDDYQAKQSLSITNILWNHFMR